MRFHYSCPNLTEADVAEVVSVLGQQYLSQGPIVGQLETKLRRLFSVKHAVVCNSGTAALHMTYDGIGLGPRAGLITSSVTFLATANAARFCDAPVGFADVDSLTGNVTVDTLKTAVNAAKFDVKAIAAVHLGGRPCDITEIKDYADSIGAYLIEDACHAPMAQYKNNSGEQFSVGSCVHSHAATLSFHAIKHMTTGEGGVLLTNDDELAERARLFRSHGITRDVLKMDDVDDAGSPWYYEMHQLGYNYRLSEINCALCLNQVTRLSANIRRRQEIAKLYHSFLGDLDALHLPEITPSNGTIHAWHLFAPAFDFDHIGKSRKQVMAELADKGIGTQVHYIPLYRQPYYRQDYSTGMFDGSEAYYKSTLSIPMYYGLTDMDVETISAGVRSVIDS
jgi:dTDP-4-amino-4,6-dideoxygalactose transaminase